LGWQGKKLGVQGKKLGTQGNLASAQTNFISAQTNLSGRAEEEYALPMRKRYICENRNIFVDILAEKKKQM